ncbi:MAG: SHOCT domain-containing protein [Candidatus Krumholzibacteriia bacterium]
MMHWFDGWHGGWMWVWWIVGIVAVAGAIWAVTRAGRRDGGRGTHRSAEDILKERYARGEIDRDEYESRLRDLRS